MMKQALLDYLLVYSRVLHSIPTSHLLKNCCQTKGKFGMVSVFLTNMALPKLVYSSCQSNYILETVN